MLLNEEQLTTANAAEMDNILADQYANTAAFDGIPPYDFKWEMYQQLQQQDMLLLVTARDADNAMSGFVLYTVVESPHHRGMRVAECDSLVVRPASRGGGIGAMLCAYAEPLLKARGVKRVSHRYRIVYNTIPLFPSLGYRMEEAVYVKDMET